MTLIMMMMAITVIMTFKKIKLLTLGPLLFFYSHAYIQFQLVRSRHTGVSTLNSHKLEMYWRAINTIYGARLRLPHLVVSLNFVACDFLVFHIFKCTISITSIRVNQNDRGQG